MGEDYHFDKRAIYYWATLMTALREVVTNMVVHRNYRDSGHSIIKIYDDGMEFFLGYVVLPLAVESCRKG